MTTPTKKQTQLLDFVAEFTEKNGYSPSYREIMHAMNLKSVSAVAEHVDNCVKLGFMQKVAKSARSLEVIKPKTYDETRELFDEKLTELAANNPQDERIGRLKEAAEILGIDL